MQTLKHWWNLSSLIKYNLICPESKLINLFGAREQNE